MEDKKKVIADRAKQFNKGSYDNIKINARKELRLNELLLKGAKKNGISKAQYVILALSRQLHQDGIEVDMENAYKYNVGTNKERTAF